MKKEPDTTPQGEHAGSLTKVLGQSEQVEELVKESAAELSSVNSDIAQKMAKRPPPPDIEHLIEKNAAVENKVHDASAKLAAVNLALENEVRARALLDHQLAAAKEQEEAARYAAFHDLLTGLPNRALFNDRLGHGLEQAKRHDWTLAVMFLDLDKFKYINDTYGHDAGDLVLRTTAQRLRDNTRGDDTVSRYSGDEFLYLLTEIEDEKNIALLAQKIIKAIQMPCGLGDNHPDLYAGISASIGIAIYPRDGSTADALIRNADAAMYLAKQNKSGYEFAR